MKPITTPSLQLRPVPGWPGKYACPQGKVYSLKEVGCTKHNDGYLRVSVRLSPTRTLRPGAHRLVCLAFHGKAPHPRAEVRHLNGKKHDNRPENLCWGTRSENARDLIQHYRESGKAIPNTKLTVKQVLAVYRSKKPQQWWASKLGVSKSTIGAIRRGQNWTHLTHVTN